MSTKRNYEAIEQTDGLTATSLHQQVQEAQEAYFDIERELEASMSIMQEVIELFEDGEDVTNVVSRMRRFIEEQQL